jgi:DNA-binding GntR family transcriptional regulator
VSIFQYRDSTFPQRNKVALDDHEGILTALIAGRADQAAAALAQHLVNARDGVLADLFTTPDSTA